MGRYLEALKQLELEEKNENGNPTTLKNLNNPSSASILGLLGTAPSVLPEKKAADIPMLCELLGVSWGRVEAEQILSPYDCGQIDSGAYRVVDLISYLIGAKDANYQMPFGVMSEKETVTQLQAMKLSVPTTETVSAWITKNREVINRTGRRCSEWASSDLTGSYQA
jgi:hypothetical protein